MCSKRHTALCWIKITGLNLFFTHARTTEYVIFDAANVWSSEYTKDTLHQFGQTFALKSTEDYILKLRSACGSGDVSVVVQDSSAELHVSSSPVQVTLSRLEGHQAAKELKELLFRMADSLTQADSKCGSPSVSHQNHQRRPAEFEPQQQNCAPSVAMKKLFPGASLINPGTKRKRQATGVAFDDVDED
ncbi:protein PAXX isoform X2 [Cottoperca gobio]|uniref:Protein PAXX isoform X2 n=1 Tax=Cottoperca gobio TaxID=56716 RepID=A0A6J2QEK7_COTGO|nr:protein PAXX isoform X2 [Cottoperca gobio]